jgi:hypothetical protein
MGSPGPLSNILDKGLTIPLYLRDAQREMEIPLEFFGIQFIGVIQNSVDFMTR